MDEDAVVIGAFIVLVDFLKYSALIPFVRLYRILFDLDEGLLTPPSTDSPVFPPGSSKTKGKKRNDVS